MPGFIQIMDNPNGGEESKEATWFKKLFGDRTTSPQVKKETPEHIHTLQIQQTNLQIQMQQTNRELAMLCEKFNRLTKQLAEEGRKNQPEHRRLEVDEE